MTYRSVHCIVVLAASALLLTGSRAAHGQDEIPRLVSPVDLLTDDIEAEVEVSGDFEETLSSPTTNVHLLVGKVQIRQGGLTVTGTRLALFVSPSSFGYEIAVYGEDLLIRTVEGQQSIAARAFRLQTKTTPKFATGASTPAASNDHPLLRQAIVRLFPQVTAETSTASFPASQDVFSPPLPEAAPSTSKRAARRVRIRPRSNDSLRFESFNSRDTVPEERINVITGGVNVLVEGITFDLQGREVAPGIVDLSADRVVIWTQAGEGDAIEAGDLIVQNVDSHFQVYMEGNIVIRQDQNTIHATHAFFDAASDRALLLNAELKVFVPTTGGYFRVRAERMRQLSRDRFHAQNAWGTSSPYGKPGYRLQASDIFVEPRTTVIAGIDPVSGQQIVDQSHWVTSLNNEFVLGNTPLLYVQKISGPIEDPGIPIRGGAVSSDRIFGVQVNTVWDLTKLLGLPVQRETRLDLLADFRSRRGPGTGIRGEYDSTNSLGPYQGNGTLYYQYDYGSDNLGLDRRHLNPPSTQRGEVIWRHRQTLPDDALIFGEIGYLSDRNFLEQYNEIQYDTDKDAETILGLRQDQDAFSGMLWGRVDVPDFEATTNWLPRADAYAFSQPLFGGLLYWNMHSSAGYADMHRMKQPTDPTDPYTPFGLPYVTDANGLVAMTRHEFDMPFNVGPVVFEPFVMGEAAWWDQGFSSQSVDRYLLNAGIRARLSASRILPFVRSDVLNLNGLAHKHDTLVEYSWTDVSAGINQIPQYNEIDENAQERFRSRYALQIFPGVIPSEFNPRNYAIRAGAGLWTSAPYHELADRQQVVRLGFRDRLQTKTGPASTPRIRDWMVWEYGISFFPKSERDNFGQDFGLLYSRYRWNISDRTSILTDGTWDFFDQAQSVWSAGVLSQRSLRGSVYAGFRQVTAGDYLDSQTLIGSYSYQMSPKWISTASCAYDVASGEARGTSLTISRVGLDWILNIGMGVDVSKNNAGFGISLEPRFGPPNATNLSYLLGL